MLRRLAAQALAVVREAAATPATAPPVESGETEVERLRRQKDEYYDLAVRLERQRDEWKDMFFVQAREHGNAQAMLETKIERLAVVCQSLFASLNKAREKLGQDQIKPGDFSTAASAKNYREAMEALVVAQQERSPLIDAKAELAKIGE